MSTKDRTRKYAKERKRKYSQERKECKRAQMSAKEGKREREGTNERARTSPHNDCKRPGLNVYNSKTATLIAAHFERLILGGVTERLHQK